MTTTSRDEASFSHLLLSWLAYRLFLVMAAIEAPHPAIEIAAAAAASNNPQGA